MRSIFLASCLAFACGTETIELVGFPDADTQEDAAEDAGTPDMGTPDMGTPDIGTPDSGTPCVCRQFGCTMDIECRAILRSTCDLGTNYCTGSLGTCETAADCTEPGTWSCTVDETTMNACP